MGRACSRWSLLSRTRVCSWRAVQIQQPVLGFPLGKSVSKPVTRGFKEEKKIGGLEGEVVC